MIMSTFTGLFVLLGLGLILIKLFHKLWWSPTRTQYLMNLQGIKGPSYRFIHGNIREILRIKSEAKSRPIGLSHSMLPKVDPHIELWRQIYGKNFLQWHGLQAQLVITQPELIQEVLYNKEGAYQKLNAEGFAKKLIGDIPKGDKWKKVRKLQNYAFHGESLKGMISSMISSVEVMLERWKHDEDKEIEAFEEFRLLSSEVISRSAFGSSYQEGEHIFKMLRRMAFLAIRNVYKVNIPGISKLFKTADEIESDNLDKEIRSCIMVMIRKRKEKVLISGEDGFGNDFLGLLLMAHHAANENLQITVDDVVEQCKKFYFAGQETTNSLLGWTVFLLALHTNWQEEARKEVIKLFGQENPNPDGIAKLKTMTMVINECLRLYSPAIGVARQVEKEVSLGSLNLPKNMNIYISILAVHHDPEIWGEDVHQFKPKRFSKGVVKAVMNINNAATAAFFPFGLGPQNCVGSNFSITETKIALSMILQRYSFILSPTYVHVPMLYVTIRPQHGVQIQLHPL